MTKIKIKLFAVGAALVVSALVPAIAEAGRSWS